MSTRLGWPLAIAGVLLAAAACAAHHDDGTGAAKGDRALPRVRVLGTVQDGGFPHAACGCVRCRAAREEPSRRRRVASLAILLPRDRAVHLIDATPDLHEQLASLRVGFETGSVDRAPVDGVWLTHAHIGHYLGLAFFGFEAVHTRELPVYCSPAMADFLRRNGPWSQLVDLDNVSLRELTAGETVDLGDGVTVTAWDVPHRDEFTDTFGFVVRGPTRSLLYVPDTDSWEAWDPPIDKRLAGIDVAILDGSFYSKAELPGRDVGEIGHPLITASMDRLEPLVSRGALEVYFTHLNHSNPALDPAGAERLEIERRGFHVLAEGQELPL